MFCDMLRLMLSFDTWELVVIIRDFDSNSEWIWPFVSLSPQQPITPQSTVISPMGFDALCSTSSCVKWDGNTFRRHILILVVS